MSRRDFALRKSGLTAEAQRFCYETMAITCSKHHKNHDGSGLRKVPSSRSIQFFVLNEVRNGETLERCSKSASHEVLC
jgi:hypothetical protein